jgi:hypothetical protein
MGAVPALARRVRPEDQLIGVDVVDPAQTHGP